MRDAIEKAILRNPEVLARLHNYQAADAERDMLLTEEKRLNDQIEGRFVEKPHKAPEDRLEEVRLH